MDEIFSATDLPQGREDEQEPGSYRLTARDHVFGLHQGEQRPPCRSRLVLLPRNATRAARSGRFTGMLLGSVSTYVAGYVAAPVVVVRPGPMVVHAEIAVGFDGSAESEAALTYAFEEARLRGCRMRAVYALQLPVHVYTPGIVYDIDGVRRAQQDYALGKLAAWQVKYPEVKVAVDIVCAHPVTALVEASQKADLLVVGSRGHGAIGAVVLGSVSRAVLQHAHCDVVVWSRTTSRADEVGKL
jgi:nucleotide-binding universal stress UspA family protein